MDAAGDTPELVFVVVAGLIGGPAVRTHSPVVVALMVGVLIRGPVARTHLPVVEPVEMLLQVRGHGRGVLRVQLGTLGGPGDLVGEASKRDLTGASPGSRVAVPRDPEEGLPLLHRTANPSHGGVESEGVESKRRDAVAATGTAAQGGSGSRGLVVETEPP